MLHFVTSYMQQNKSRKQTLESAQYGLEISFNLTFRMLQHTSSEMTDITLTASYKFKFKSKRATGHKLIRDIREYSTNIKEQKANALNI